MHIPDAFLYAESGGERHVVVAALDAQRLRELGGLTVHTLEEFGQDDMIAARLPPHEITVRCSVRAAKTFGIREGLVPGDFPISLADALRKEGIQLEVAPDHFIERRRVKNEQELTGIRRAQRAAEVAMDSARSLLRSAQDNGQAITSEQIKAAIHRTFAEHDCTADEVIVAHGSQAGTGHHMGSGLIERGETVVIDLWPRDRTSGCYADMTRTYVMGDPPPAALQWHRTVLSALETVLAEARTGVGSRTLFDRACDVIEGAGYKTKRTKEKGKPLEDGFRHGLGHGIGLAVHEEPRLDLTTGGALMAGEVITLEPGVYQHGTGGVRLEDMVLITESGHEPLTSYPYGLEP